MQNLRAPERCSFHPAVNSGSPPIAHVLGAMKSSRDSRSQAQVVRSKQPAYSLALPALCMMVSGVDQPLARWAINYRGAFQKRLGTQRNRATLWLTALRCRNLLMRCGYWSSSGSRPGDRDVSNGRKTAGIPATKPGRVYRRPRVHHHRALFLQARKYHPGSSAK